MKHTNTIMDIFGNQVEMLQARIAQLEQWQANANALFAKMQPLHDFVKGEPEEAATQDPTEAILAVMRRWKEEASRGRAEAHKASE